ncbi:MAG: hypothetical protein M5R36_07490 [Deltaproteobacteria bacterium]|nr:hypothetical protein [Deltaproteobacteria bacterium]
MIKPFGGKSPNIAPDAFIAPGVVVIGDVTIGAQSSLWYNTVVRGTSAASSSARAPTSRTCACCT